ncbi:Brp/Blh family beta-carotene 15,15'-dioxygenase [Sphingomonas rubra]|uniref:Probable beta-carotene 15,15'-dioxygenase n=1 Tax=Sphingomonas rubra TaxID=634430 RepID=A0A1I5TGW4_9SPHN|nr:Brp/Blh family beta-carotene 15,15'-dioxygenase [Sphingomonas rubra]SFP82265.1 beta-carotene 15,15'-monooxygenase, Brp/Blh family [Sphingomonas rubra]
MTLRAPAWGWSALLGAATAASFGSLPVQLAFAIVAIGMVGMAHGASDLAIVPNERHAVFLVLYGLVATVCLLWWLAEPAVALPAFLIASAIHFGLEDAPGGTVIEKIARGASLVATPAALHSVALADILRLGGISPQTLPAIVGTMVVVGAVTAGGLMFVAFAHGDRRLLAGTTALLILPPLIGFSVGFLILHAVPQTDERRRQLGCADYRAYLRATWPILLAAVMLAGLVGVLLLRRDPSGVRSLFAAIAALAMPHLLVTPWFDRRAASAVRSRATVPIADRLGAS